MSFILQRLIRFTSQQISALVVGVVGQKADGTLIGIDGLPISTGGLSFTAAQNTAGAVNVIAQTNLNKYLRSDGASIFELSNTNSFYGIESGASNIYTSVTSGAQNTYFGYQTAKNNVDGYANTAFGFGALGDSVSAEGVVSIGYQSGQLGNASYCTYIGVDAGMANNANDNTFIGWHCGAGATARISGTRNVFVGHDSAGFLTTGTRNTILGSLSGYSLTTGSDNTLIGNNAGLALTTGINNVFVGGESGKAATNADGLVSLGFRSSFNLTTGYASVAIGQYAGFSATIAGKNTSIGNSAGFSNVASDDNTFIGNNAGYNAVGSSGIGSNTVIGSVAGFGLTTGTSNVFIGAGAGANITTGSQNTVIGTQNASSATVSNTVEIYAGVDLRVVSDAKGLRAGTPGSPTMTGGFTMAPAGSGTPTGAPSALAGFAPIYIDTTNSRLYVNILGAWKSVLLV